MKEQDVLKFLVGGTHQSVTNLDFQKKTTKGKSDHICAANLKRTGDSLRLVDHVMVTIEFFFLM